MLTGAGRSSMDEICVGTLADFADGARRFVMVGDREVGIVLWRGDFFAYENRCIHQGGPVCEGTVIGRVEVIVDESGRAVGQRFDDDDPHLVCPWHGVEYELRTGECVVDRRRRLRRYHVTLRGDDVYLAE
jgi:nitrite reductase/ring-hydroxylating ferredoxin subunit